MVGECWSARRPDGYHCHRGLNPEVAVAYGATPGVYLVVGLTGGWSEAPEPGGVQASGESPSQESPQGGGGQ